MTSFLLSLTFATLFITVAPSARAQAYLGLEYVGTSNLKVNDDSSTQAGPGPGILGGATFSLFEPLGLHHGLEANLQMVDYNAGGNREQEWNFLHLTYVLRWRLSAMAMDFPLGLAALYGPHSYNQTAKEFGVRAAFMDLEVFVPWIHARWMSVNSNTRIIMASTGLNFQF